MWQDVSQWRAIVVGSIIVAALGFNNIVAFIDYMGQIPELAVIQTIPRVVIYLLIAVVLVVLLNENKRIAKAIAGAI